MIRCVFFDFDGLILETETPALQSWQEIYQEYGCVLPLSVWANHIGTSADSFSPSDYLEAQLGRPVDREHIRRKCLQRCNELIAGQGILPGVEDYIADAKGLGLKLAVVSSSSREWVLGHLLRLGIRTYFDSIKCSDDVHLTKPDPELYHLVLKELSLRPEEGIALEDSPNGVLAAKRAGVFCVAVPNSLTRQLSLAQADMQLNSLADLPLDKLLIRIRRGS